MTSERHPPPMTTTRRRHLAADALSGYVSGPDAPLKATELAMARASDCRAVVLVEGISDQIALEVLATRLDRDLDAEGVVIFPVGGAQALQRYVEHFGPTGKGYELAGMCDVGEELIVRRALASAGIGTPQTRPEMRSLGFHVCVEDLEDELIRAVGTDTIETLLDTQGDLGSFRTMQKQPEWRSRETEAQLRRFFGSGARRKLRYARLLVEAMESARYPEPLVAVLDAVREE